MKISLVLLTYITIDSSLNIWPDGYAVNFLQHNIWNVANP